MGTFLLCWLGIPFCHAQNVILHLRNGDRITGRILSESTNEVVVTTAFTDKLVIPGNLVDRKEAVAVPSPVAPPPASPPPAVSGLNTNLPTTPATGIVGDLVLTNKPSMAQAAGGAAKPAPPPAKAVEPPPKPPEPSAFRKFLSDWRGEAQLGANLGISTINREAFTGRLKLTHNQEIGAGRALRNIFDYNVSYGTTDNVLSDNRMEGTWKTEYDFSKRFLVYNATRAGYDEIRGVNFQYDVGPGLGYKWILLTNFVFKTELGGDYQEQFFIRDDKTSRYSLRIAEDMWWQISPKIRWDERIEFFPEVQEFSHFRVRVESNLSYLLKQNLTLSLSIIDLYDTLVPIGISKNDVQVRSLLGIRF